MKQNKTKWIGRMLKIYVSLIFRAKKRTILNSEIEFQRIAIFSTTALGDLMFNTPAINALKLRYPDASFVLVSSEKNKQIVEGSPVFDSIYYWDNKIRNAHRLIKSLRSFKPQLTVILHSYMPYDILCSVLSGSDYVIRDNYKTDNLELNFLLDAYSSKYNGHLIQRKLNLLSLLGCQTDKTEMFIPVPYTPASERKGRPIIGFQMGASELKRCWPVSRFVELATLLIEKYDIVLIGGKKDCPLVVEFRMLSGEKLFSRIENKVGKTSLTELLTVIDSFKVLVTGDTGPLHLAIALKTSTVSLYADAEPAHTGPYQDKFRHIILKYKKSDYFHEQPLAEISANLVYEKIIALE